MRSSWICWKHELLICSLPIRSASAYLMKHPPEQMSDAAARDAVEAFIAGKSKR